MSACSTCRNDKWEGSALQRTCKVCGQFERWHAGGYWEVFNSGALPKVDHQISLRTDSEWTPPSLQNKTQLIREGCETFSGVAFIRWVRWDGKGFVLEALVREKSQLLDTLDTTSTELDT